MGNQKITFGYVAPNRGTLFGVTTLDEIFALAKVMDQSPIMDRIWVGDNLLTKPRPESLVLLGGLATATQRLSLGVSCMASFPVRDPILFAYQWATLDLLSHGRMLLAACNGIVKEDAASEREGSYWGVASDRDRVPRMEESIEICRRLWSEDDVTFSGKYRSFANLTLTPKPVQQPCPIWIAVTPDPKYIDSAMKRVARLADGWLTSAHGFPTNIAKLNQYLTEGGRDPDTFPNNVVMHINIHPDRDTAIEQTKKWWANYYGPASPPPISYGTAAGTPQQVIDKLNEVVRMGARGFALRLTSWQQKEQFEILANEVLPHVRA